MSKVLFKARQKGAILVISLLLLLVASIVTVTAMRGSNMQERMVSNQNNQAIAFLAAETGASEFWNWLSSAPLDWDNISWQNSWQDVQSLPVTSSGEPFVAEFGYYWIDPASDINWLNDRVEVIVNGWAKTGENTAPLAQVSLQLVFMRPIAGGVDPSFMAGLLAGGNIQVNGNANLNGSAHANGNFNVTGGGSSLNDRAGVDDDGNPVTITSMVSAQGSASMSGAAAGSVTSNTSARDIPSASAYISTNSGNPGVINSCSIPSGDLGGAVYYCNGNATTSGNFSNVTIMATGNIVHNGAAQLGGDLGSTLTVSMIAGGNITVNGSNSTYGVFWMDGNLTQNGSSTLGGSIVAGGNITRNGRFNYTQFDDFGNLDLPSGVASELSISRWVELR
ncbi:pilus assembly PilX family protein [Nitrincola alkalilacustris]|uniref:pilus assembly PilX family protein n=1 Tax=Nitrincola alkalilacustris TaxID=1571224 RepID=UPI00124F1577|nr:PilX N-terminal domain-containing pilus assembly protein [Nitrincola alkalilacustris]